ncbi:MAG: hypothetical protein HY422_02720 [Candidatus Komeilibacteria bacterium]|nr:hypothetical protein [Candidatus Komeilibacteria bacterium]
MKQNVSSIKSWISLKQLIIPVIAAFFVAVTVYATTTIGDNISTGGTLAVTGLSTFARATSTSATSTEYLYVGFDITEPTGWDFSGGDLAVSGDAYFNNKATSSAAFWVGSGGTPNWLNLGGGDLFVQDDTQIGDSLFSTHASSTQATTTDYLYVGFDITEPTGWDFAGGDFLASGDAYFNNKATSSVAFWVGSGGTPNSLNLTGGDLFVQDDAQIGDALTVGGTATSTALIVGGTATTTKLIVGERAAANATTTIVLGDLIAESAPCIKLRTTAGEWVYSYPTSSASMVLQGLVWTADSCE